MRKLLFLSIIIWFNLNTSYSQEWFSSFEVAKRYATVNNKMLFVIWEDSLNDVYPIAVNNDKGKEVFLDLSENNEIDAIIWEHFIPVLLPESEYEKFYKLAKRHDPILSYIDKLNNESIKIMDINGHILNTRNVYKEYDNLSVIVDKYALNTSFLKQDLVNYSTQPNFTTAFNIGMQYLDYAIVMKKVIRPEVVNLANIYFKRAKQFIAADTLEKEQGYTQLLELTTIKTDLVLGKVRRANRSLKKIDETTKVDLNQSLYSFLKYVIFKSSKDEEHAALWKDKVTASDLKKAEFILKNNN